MNQNLTITSFITNPKKKKNTLLKGALYTNHNIPCDSILTHHQNFGSIDQFSFVINSLDPVVKPYYLDIIIPISMQLNNLIHWSKFKTWSSWYLNFDLTT